MVKTRFSNSSPCSIRPAASSSLAVEAIDLERDVRIALRQLTRRNKRLATDHGVPLFDLQYAASHC